MVDTFEKAGNAIASALVILLVVVLPVLLLDAGLERYLCGQYERDYPGRQFQWRLLDGCQVLSDAGQWVDTEVF